MSCGTQLTARECKAVGWSVHGAHSNARHGSHSACRAQHMPQACPLRPLPIMQSIAVRASGYRSIPNQWPTSPGVQFSYKTIPPHIALQAMARDNCGSQLTYLHYRLGSAVTYSSQRTLVLYGERRIQGTQYKILLGKTWQCRMVTCLSVDMWYERKGQFGQGTGACETEATIVIPYPYS